MEQKLPISEFIAHYLSISLNCPPLRMAGLCAQFSCNQTPLCLSLTDYPSSWVPGIL